MASSFTYKTIDENELFTFNYSQVLQPAESITSAVCNVFVIDGVDPNPSAILSGTPVISNANVSQRILGGLAEVTYRLEMVATTNYGNVYSAIGDLPVYNVYQV
jgi:hypothetical protein